MTLLRVIAAVLFAVGLMVSGPSMASDSQNFEKALAAYKRSDYAEAVRLYRLAAEQGDALAQNILGLMYANGQGVPQDYAEAVRLYRLAAEQGNASAQNILGLMYAYGYGVPKDTITAYMWFNLSAAQGHDGASKNRGIEEKRLTAAGLETSQRLSRECLARSYKNC